MLRLVRRIAFSVLIAFMALIVTTMVIKVAERAAADASVSPCEGGGSNFDDFCDLD